MAITIKNADTKDAPAILDLQKEAYQSEALIYQGITLPPMVQTLEEMEGDIRSMTVLKASEDSRIIGSVRASEEGGICRIGRLVVAPDFQGRGIGTMLMAAIEKAFPSAGTFELFTGEKSVKNLGLYKKLGYAPNEARPISLELTLVFLRKKNRPDNIETPVPPG